MTSERQPPDGTADDGRPGDEDESLVRPYIITGGKTRASESDLPIEAVVATSAGAPTYLLGFERQAITRLCNDPTSIAEVASSLDLPLGVARFLVTDLTQQGYLDTQGTADANDAALLEQLIEGIRAL